VTAVLWDELHTDARHRLRYPSEHVVRFLAGLRPGGNGLDVGCGMGRHLRLLEEQGFVAHGVDASLEAVAFCRDLAPVGGVCRASMTALPYPAGLFDVAVAYGVFYYGSRWDGERAVSELWRVLRPGGSAFVCVRSDRDWRVHGVQEGEPEHGMELHFMSEGDVVLAYRDFGSVRFELAETTTRGRARTNSDWLVTVTK
jgi:SAM-dependent methyltransferase